MKLNEISPFVRQAIIGRVGNTYNRADTFRHLRTQDCRLFYIISGVGKLVLHGTEYDLKPNAAILFQSGTEYIWDTKQADFFTINFDYTMDHCSITSPFHPVHSKRFNESDILETVYFEDAEVLNSPLYTPDARFIEPMLRTISSTYHLKGEFSSEILTSYMKAIITALVYNSKKHVDKNSNITADTVNNIIGYIQSNYNKDLSNSDIADMFRFNHSYIGRIFKQHTGSTIHQFLVDYRINIAKELLRSQKSSIHSIAREVGFNDSHHFVKYFKKKVGKTPTEYRKSNMQ